MRRLGRFLLVVALVLPVLGLAVMWFLPLATLAWRLVATLGTLLAAALALLLRRGRGAPRAEAPRPRAFPELRAGVARALETFRASDLGRRRGRAAKYELPWFLVLGEPGAGKSAAVLRSGLAFPVVTGASGAGDPCRWAFSGDGVFLDAPGRYGREGEDPAEWREFLAVLEASRPACPLNGILAVAEAPALADPAAAADLGRRLRARVQDVESALGMKLPVYLLFTKADRVAGFREFFAGLPPEARRRPFGAALEGTESDPAEAMARHMAVLHRGLAEFGSDLLARRPGAGLPAPFTFPAAFLDLVPGLRAFARRMTGDDPYRARPCVRGFWFASADAGGDAPPWRPSPGFDLACPEPSAALPAGPFFIEDLFRHVLFPDRHLARRLGLSRRRRRDLLAAGAAACLLAALAGAWGVSFAGNRRLCLDAAADLAAWRRAGAGADPDRRLEALHGLQLRLEQIEAQRGQGRPLRLRWGLHQGARLEGELRAAWFQGVRALMLQPVKESLEATLARGLAPAVPFRPAPRPAPPAAPPPVPESLLLVRAVHVRLPAPPAPPPPARGDAERLYAALKTYLMLGEDCAQRDPSHLEDQIPRHWRPHLVRDPRRPDPGLLHMAGRTVAYFIAQIGAPDFPAIATRPDLVARARARLQGRGNASPAERAYLELRSRANARFEPLTAERILKGQDLDLVATAHAVPGAFTRRAWEEFFREAIRDCGTGLGLDWVLADGRVRELPPGELRAALAGLYKAEYAREWERFLGGLGVLAFDGPAGAAAALGRLGDPQASPLKVLLARAAFETGWDVPMEAGKAVKGVKDRVLGTRAGRILGPRPSVPVPEGPGDLARRFAFLAVAVPGEGNACPLDAYLQALLKLRTRLGAVAQGGEPGPARECLQAAVAGSASELAEARAILDNAVLARLDPRGREILGPVLRQPLRRSFASLAPLAALDLERAWARDVLVPWSTLSGKYPFADSPVDATLAEMQAFLKPREGALARFVDGHLGAFVTRREERLAPRTWEGCALEFAPGFLEGLERLGRATAFLAEAAACRFEVQPVPAPGVREILLEVDGQRLHYRNGPQAWFPFAWPGTAASAGARIQVVAFSGATVRKLDAPGSLGILRLLAQARADGPGPADRVLAWPGSGPDPAVRFNFRMVSGPDLLAFAALRHHAPPPRATP